jgi:uncharacterized membrane protein YhhN
VCSTGKRRLPRPTPSNNRFFPGLLIPVYFLVCLAYVWMGGAGFPGSWTLLVKGLILPVLIVYFHRNVYGRYTPPRRWILVGLVFSWLGDVLLSVEFVYGLVAFLLAHLAYIWAFSRGCRWRSLFRAGLPYVGPVLVYGIALLVVLYPHLGSKCLPVLFYTTAILFMLLTALARKKWVNTLSYRLSVAGAVLFVLSDSFLALRSFVSPYPFSGLLIMGTYTLAEFLIAEGGIRQETGNHRLFPPYDT